MSTTTAEVLLVEDNLDDSQLIEATLKKTHPDLNIKVVHDGEAALDCIFGTGPYAHQGNSYTPDLIILDLSLPKVNGHDVLKVLRSYARTQTIPVVVFSSSNEASIIKEGYESGTNSYIRKPQTLKEFRQAIRAIAVYWLGVNEFQSRLEDQSSSDFAA